MTPTDLTLEEKAALTAGHDVWTVPGIARLGLPPLRMTDGPNGARGGDFAGSVRAMCVPCGSALAATFDPDLLQQVGALLGREARQKRSRVLLAPTINLVRSPLFGRAFECYGEDPWLAGKLAAAFVTGVQSEGVATTPKHLVGNECEHERFTINSVIDERTLRELYLTPFEWAIRHANSLGVMTSYNRVNGDYCTEKAELLNGILRNEWGFEGFVVSDWFAAGDTIRSLEAGLDVQMPGPDRFFGEPVAKAVANGEVDEAHLDALVARRMHVHATLDAWDDDASEPELAVEHLADRKLAHQAAAASMVLLENDGLLPLDPNTASIALIGPNATTAHIMGGGSARLAAHRKVPPAAVFEERFGNRVRVEQGCVIDKNAPPLRPDGTLDVEFFLSDDWTGPVVGTKQQRGGFTIWNGSPHEAVGAQAFTARLTGMLTPIVTGEHTFTLIQVGPTRVSIDGTVVLDGISEQPPRGEAFFGLGSIEVQTTVELTAGQTVDVLIETIGGAGTGIRGFSVGHQPPIPADLMDRAVAAATEADVAVVIVGTSAEWETEGNDRASMDLPGEQVALIEAVCAVNPRTCVVVNAGAPVDLTWADKPAAVLFAWLGGQEMAPALADVLFGELEPAGRLPVTMPITIEHTPAYGNFPGESNTTRYGEGLLVGYRWYGTRKLPVAYPFGHGGSYTTFDWSTPTVHTDGPAAGRVEVTVTNTGNRAGSDVVQLYLSPGNEMELFRPEAELVGAAKVHLAAGESETVAIALNPRSFAYWDTANTEHIALNAKMRESAGGLPVGSSTDSPPVAGWHIDAGDYELRVAHSATNIASTATFAIADALGPLSAAESLP